MIEAFAMMALLVQWPEEVLLSGKPLVAKVQVVNDGPDVLALSGIVIEAEKSAWRVEEKLDLWRRVEKSTGKPPPFIGRALLAGESASFSMTLPAPASKLGPGAAKVTVRHTELSPTAAEGHVFTYTRGGKRDGDYWAPEKIKKSSKRQESPRPSWQDEVHAIKRPGRALRWKTATLSVAWRTNWHPSIAALAAKGNLGEFRAGMEPLGPAFVRRNGLTSIVRGETLTPLGDVDLEVLDHFAHSGKGVTGFYVLYVTEEAKVCLQKSFKLFEPGHEAAMPRIEENLSYLNVPIADMEKLWASARNCKLAAVMGTESPMLVHVRRKTSPGTPY